MEARPASDEFVSKVGAWPAHRRTTSEQLRTLLAGLPARKCASSGLRSRSLRSWSLWMQRGQDISRIFLGPDFLAEAGRDALLRRVPADAEARARQRDAQPFPQAGRIRVARRRRRGRAEWAQRARPLEVPCGNKSDQTRWEEHEAGALRGRVWLESGDLAQSRLNLDADLAAVGDGGRRMRASSPEHPSGNRDSQSPSIGQSFVKSIPGRPRGEADAGVAAVRLWIRNRRLRASRTRSARRARCARWKCASP